MVSVSNAQLMAHEGQDFQKTSCSQRQKQPKEDLERDGAEQTDTVCKRATQPNPESKLLSFTKIAFSLGYKDSKTIIIS